MERQRVSTGTRWEPVIGYSRAVRVGDRVLVSGTTATDEDGEVDGTLSAEDQTRRALANVERALERAGAELADVVRTRLYVTDVGEWAAVGRAHWEYFGEVRPATSMVEVSALIDPAMVVEVEAEAVVGTGEGESAG